MRQEKCRKHGLFRTIAFAVALGMYSAGLTASAQQPALPPQPPEVVASYEVVIGEWRRIPSATPQSPDVAAPDAFAVLPAKDTESASGADQWAFSNALAGVDRPAPPACCDPISQPCADPCAPKWTVQASAIAMTRTDPNGATLLLLGVPPASTPFFDASQLNFDYQAGFDVGLRRTLGPASELELRYFGIEDMTATSPTFAFPAFTTFSFGTTPPTTRFFPADGTMSLGYESALHSGEVNYWQSISSTWKIAAGFRMLEVNENLAFNFAATNGGSLNLDWDVDNRLYGFQVGAEGLLYQFNNLALNGVVKAGVFENGADSNMRYRENGTLFNVGQTNNSTTAFVGEAGLAALYRVSRNVSLREGYQLLFVDGGALASDQVAHTTGFAGPGVVPMSLDFGNVLYHGGSLGLELGW